MLADGISVLVTFLDLKRRPTVRLIPSNVVPIDWGVAFDVRKGMDFFRFIEQSRETPRLSGSLPFGRHRQGHEKWRTAAILSPVLNIYADPSLSWISNRIDQ